MYQLQTNSRMPPEYWVWRRAFVAVLVLESLFLLIMLAFLPYKISEINLTRKVLDKYPEGKEKDELLRQLDQDYLLIPESVAGIVTMTCGLIVGFLGYHRTNVNFLYMFLGMATFAAILDTVMALFDPDFLIIVYLLVNFIPIFVAIKFIQHMKLVQDT